MSTPLGEGTQPPLLPEQGGAPLPPKEVGRQMGWIALRNDKLITQSTPIEGDGVVTFFEEREMRWCHEADPVQQVEYFLEDNAELFADCAEAWQQVATNQTEFSTMHIERQERQSRHARRTMGKKLGGMNQNNILGIAKGNGQRHLQQIQKSQKGDPYSVRKASIELYYRDVIKGVTKQTEQMGASSFEAEFELRLQRHGEAYTRAYMASDEALQRVEQLLSNDEAAKVFLKKLTEMAADPDVALNTYPGFMEIMATHVLQAGDGQNNLLQKAMGRTAPEPGIYSKEYLDAQVESTDSKGKEINAIVGVIRLMSSIVEQDYNADPADIRSRMAEHVGEWPADLQNGLEAYARTRTHENWTALREALGPYMRQGRLPLAKGIERSAAVPSRAGAGRGKPQRTATLQMGPKDQDHEQVVAPKEISDFAVVGPRIKREKFDVEPVDSLEELYELSNLAEYARKHAEDTTLPALFMATLEHLIKNPYDKSCVERLKGVEYELEGDPRDGIRRPYRFKPQSFPGVKKGEIAIATRIIFDVPILNGKRTLVIYGAFHKQQIDGMNKLPSRS